MHSPIIAVRPFYKSFTSPLHLELLRADILRINVCRRFETHFPASRQISGLARPPILWVYRLLCPTTTFCFHSASRSIYGPTNWGSSAPPNKVGRPFHSASAKPPLQVRVLVSDSSATRRPPSPVVRAQANLLTMVADSQNFACCDLANGFCFRQSFQVRPAQPRLSSLSLSRGGRPRTARHAAPCSCPCRLRRERRTRRFVCGRFRRRKIVPRLCMCPSWLDLRFR